MGQGLGGKWKVEFKIMENFPRNKKKCKLFLFITLACTLFTAPLPKGCQVVMLTSVLQPAASLPWKASFFLQQALIPPKPFDV